MITQLNEMFPWQMVKNDAQDMIYIKLQSTNLYYYDFTRLWSFPELGICVYCVILCAVPSALMPPSCYHMTPFTPVDKQIPAAAISLCHILFMVILMARLKPSWSIHSWPNLANGLRIVLPIKQQANKLAYFCQSNRCKCLLCYVHVWPSVTTHCSLARCRRWWDR